MLSTSTGEPFLRSRYIDEVAEEPGAVRAAVCFSRNAEEGGCPEAVEMSTHSRSAARARAAPPGTAAISPTLPRRRQVTAPKLASWTHFCHMSPTMWEE